MMAMTDLQSKPVVEDQSVMEDKKTQLCEAPEAMMEDECKMTEEEDESKMMEEEDEEEDETLLALQQLLRTLKGTRANVAAPIGAPVRSGSSITNTQASQSPEELLETRRQERERFRRNLLASKDSQQYPTYYCEDDEEDEGLSAESQISNRFIRGSFDRLNAHIRSRSTDGAKQLPLVLLPKGGKVVSPAENPKLSIIFSQEHEELSGQLVAALDKLDNENASEQTHLLTPPRATWTIQMRHFDDSAATH